MSKAGFMSTAVRSVGHTVAALTTNCPHFKREWTQAARAPSRAPLEGRWEGQWVSEANGHHGLLRCVVTQLEESRYQASFYARYSKVLRVCYTVELTAHPSSKGLQLEGQADLGRLAGGVYQYRGEADGQRFFCTYRCVYDHGTFDLQKLNGGTSSSPRSSR